MLVGTVTPAAEPVRGLGAAVGALAAVPMQAVAAEAEAPEAVEAPVGVQAAARPVARVAIASGKKICLPMVSSL